MRSAFVFFTCYRRIGTVETLILNNGVGVNPAVMRLHSRLLLNLFFKVQVQMCNSPHNCMYIYLCLFHRHAVWFRDAAYVYSFKCTVYHLCWTEGPWGKTHSYCWCLLCTHSILGKCGGWAFNGDKYICMFLYFVQSFFFPFWGTMAENSLFFIL